MSKSWYLLRYHYGQVVHAITGLERLGVNCLSVCKKEVYESRKRGELCMITSEHIFSPYLFIEFEQDLISFSSINYTPGVNDFVRFGQQIKPINNKIINTILRTHKKNDEIDKTLSIITTCNNKNQRVIMLLSMIEKNLYLDNTIKYSQSQKPPIISWGN